MILARQEWHKKRKLQANILDEHRGNSLQKIIAKEIQQYAKKIKHHDHVEFTLGKQSLQINQCVLSH